MVRMGFTTRERFGVSRTRGTQTYAMKMEKAKISEH